MSEPSADHEDDRHLADEEARLARQAALTVRLRAAGQDTTFVEALLGVREAELRAMRLRLKVGPCLASQRKNSSVEFSTSELGA